jgi:O-antigen/teichoic acid export membrane protein
MGKLNSRLLEIFRHLFKNPLMRRVVKNSGYLFSATGITVAISMVQSILVARLLGVAGFGILGTIMMFTTVINNFTSFRMSDLVIKYVGQFSEQGDHERAEAVFKIAALFEMLASIAAFGLAWLIAPLGARYLAKDASMQGWFVVYGLILVANLITESSTGLLQIFDRFRRMASINVAQSVITVLIIAFVYISHGGFLGILIAYLIGKAVGALALTGAAIYEANHRWGLKWWSTPVSILRPQARELAYFAVSTNISASLSLINKDSELLWVSFFRNPVETGYYKLALALANLVQLPITPLPQATYPELSREVANNHWSNVRDILRQGSLLAGGYTVIASAGLLIFGRWGIRYLYTPEYLPAYPALLILLVGFLVANTFYWNRTALLAIGRADLPMKVNLVLAALKILGVILLVPIYGYLANAALMAGSYILGVSVSVLLFRLNLVKHETVVEG